MQMPKKKEAVENHNLLHLEETWPLKIKICIFQFACVGVHTYTHTHSDTHTYICVCVSFWKRRIWYQWNKSNETFVYFLLRQIKTFSLAFERRFLARKKAKWKVGKWKYIILNLHKYNEPLKHLLKLKKCILYTIFTKFVHINA